MDRDTSFVEQLMARILEGTRIPKVQVERAVGPVLGIFLADALTATLADHPELSGRYRILCPEFPLMKADSRQSTNIDWLLLNETRGELVLLELKTTSGSFSADQARLYLQRKERIRVGGARFLIADLDTIEGVSSEKAKYRFLRDAVLGRFPGGEEAMARCRVARVLYLVPSALREAAPDVLKLVDATLSFADLASDIDGPFASEWRVIRRALTALDAGAPMTSSGASIPEPAANYRARADYDSIRALCSERGAQIVVGYTGGEPALRNAGIADLMERQYKWDERDGGRGRKDPANWVAGDRFLGIVDDLQRETADRPAAADARDGNRIPLADLRRDTWYLGEGRNGNVGLWDGDDFLVLARQGIRTGPGPIDWTDGEHRIKREPYDTGTEGCFRPIRQLP